MRDVLLVIVLGLLPLGVLARTVSRARAVRRAVPAPRRGSPRMPGAGWLEHRRRLALERLKHQNGVLRDAARHRMRMREREADAARKAAAAPAGGEGVPQDGAPRPRPRPRRRVVPGFAERVAEERAPDGPAPPPPDSAQAPPRPAPPAPPSSPPQSPPSPSHPGGSDMATAAGGAVEQAVEGMHHIHAHAAAGNIRAKQAAVQALAEIFARASAMALALSRVLAEPGQHYGPEITEPLARAADLAQAAGLSCGESDAAIGSLAQMTVGELADSPRQAPHHSQMSETGAR